MKTLFLSNTTKERTLDKINTLLKTCDHFYFSVSFIKKAGLDYIIPAITSALIRGASGRVLVSTYKNFTDIQSLQTLLELSERFTLFKCHLEYDSLNGKGYHAKGYIFTNSAEINILVGSTNITKFALNSNVEWNLLHTNRTESKDTLYFELMGEFDTYWKHTLPLTIDDIHRYKEQLELASEYWDMDTYFSNKNTKVPNKMQEKALRELNKTRKMGQQKALIVSSTGSGKTFLSAIDVMQFGSTRMLYLVHRENILDSAMLTFGSLNFSNITMGKYTGNQVDRGVDYLFATTSMMSSHLDEFEPNQFDYIVADEAHHIVSPEYSKIIEYFTPSFLLGMTATPERLDQQDVFKVFGYNVPYHLRLRDAIKYKIVVPFKYFGIRNKNIDYGDIRDLDFIDQMMQPNNIELILENLSKFIDKNNKINGQKLMAIAFCKTIHHAKAMERLFNSNDLPSIHLDGNSSIDLRQKTFNRLQNPLEPLNIICAVDILNEGIDIPLINLVMFLRPTESPTIFLQQLGRGLRTSSQKKQLIVLDFIGNNYRRSIQLLKALGQLSNTDILEKKYLAQLIQTDFDVISKDLGVEIFMDELTKNEFLAILANENFNTKNFLMNDYKTFKNFLNTDSYPKHIDYFDNEYAPDLIRLLKSPIKNKTSKSYYSFLKNIGEASISEIDSSEQEFIDKISELLPLVRLHEFRIIEEIIAGMNSKEQISQILLNELGSASQTSSAWRILAAHDIISDGDLVTLVRGNPSKFSVEFIEDLLNYGKKRYEYEFQNDISSSDIYKLYHSYYKEQALMLINHYSMTKGTIYKNNNVYIFVNLKKDLSIEDHLHYNDVFLSPTLFQWESMNGVLPETSEGRRLVSSQKVFLFVRKMEQEDGVTMPFTYFGTGEFLKDPIISAKKEKSMIFKLKLDTPVDRRFELDFSIPQTETN